LVTATLADARAAFLSTGYSRLPVYGERRDEIVGLPFRKDLDMGRIPREGFDLKELVRLPTFIPATASLGEALRQMQSVRVHFVFVIDEHGGMEGILTLEDLLEEIVGEINDEYDEEAREQIRRDGKTYLLDGMLSVRDANQYLKLGRFLTLPFSASAARFHGSDFAHGMQAHRGYPAESSFLSYGLVVHLLLLPTPPLGDAVAFGFRPESVYLERTCTSLSARALRRTCHGLAPWQVHAECF
jgi:hypothetical protein